MATKSGSKFSPLKKQNDETEASENDHELDHEIMNVSYTPTSSSSTFKKGIDRIMKLYLYTHCSIAIYVTIYMIDT